MKLISNSIDESQQHLATALFRYALVRSETPYQLVGQFMDREGALHKQEGIYGMAGWCTLTSEANPEICINRNWSNLAVEALWG